MSQETEKAVVRCQQCGTVLEPPKPGQKAVICPGCGAAYVVHAPNAGWLRRSWELIQYRRSRRKAAKAEPKLTMAEERAKARESISEPVTEPAKEQKAGQVSQPEKIIKLPSKKKVGKRKWLILLPFAAVLAITLAVAVPRARMAANALKWEKLQLSWALPEPDFPIEKVIHNEKDLMTVDFCPVEKEQFMDYLRRCEEEGFSWKPRYGDSMLRLYSEKGWAMKLSYMDSDRKLCLFLKPTVTLGPMRWPSETLPQPPAMYSYTKYNREKFFWTYVGPMDHDQWTQYVDQIMSMGYVYDLSRRRDSFTGSRKTGETLEIDYEGNDVVVIRYDCP